MICVSVCATTVRLHFTRCYKTKQFDSSKKKMVLSVQFALNFATTPIGEIKIETIYTKETSTKT